MDTKYLYLMALLCAGVAFYVYRQSPPDVEKVVISNELQDYTAHGIRLTQTDAFGKRYADVSAKELVHYKTNQRAELKDIQATWYVNGTPNAKFTAQHGEFLTMPDGRERMTLTGQVQVDRFKQADQPAIAFSTEEIHSYPASKQIQVNTPLHFRSIQSEFDAEGLFADFNTGAIEFNQIKLQQRSAQPFAIPTTSPQTVQQSIPEQSISQQPIPQQLQ